MTDTRIKKEDGVLKCTVLDCKQTFSTYKKSNIDRHFERQHMKEKKPKESIMNFAVGVNLSRYDTVLRGFVKEVCLSGRPLDIIHDWGMPDITGNISVSAEALEQALDSDYTRGKTTFMADMDGKLGSLN
ncbi:MAG: hypothetical protein MHPSP_003851, partial [Paramarteilia canceri]